MFFIDNNITFFSIIVVLKFASQIIFSLIGAFIVIMGLYLLLWGKEGDKEVDFKTKVKWQYKNGEGGLEEC